MRTFLLGLDSSNPTVAAGAACGPAAPPDVHPRTAIFPLLTLFGFDLPARIATRRSLIANLPRLFVLVLKFYPCPHFQDRRERSDGLLAYLEDDSLRFVLVVLE